MAQLSIKDILAKPLQKRKPLTCDFDRFTTAFNKFIQSLNPQKAEEYNKGKVRDFLLEAFYQGKNAVDPTDGMDEAILADQTSTSSIEVIIEAKAPSNKQEMPSHKNLNCKGMQELVLYFMRQRVQKNNIRLKHLIATNGYEWFVFDAAEFEKYFYQDKTFRTLYEEYDNDQLIFNKTIDFYEGIASPAINNCKLKIQYTYFDIRLLNSVTKKMEVYKLLSPDHLLKQFKFTDSNSLNASFYHELLHIIGLEERDDDGKKIIDRKLEGNRDHYSILESAIYQLEEKNISEEDKFEKGLNLSITWINRILFLKLLESQLISYHDPQLANEYKILSTDKISCYNELNELFFKVLAVPLEKRNEYVRDKFKNVPYLNSSLFEYTENEEKNLLISGLKEGNIPLYKNTILKDQNGKRAKKEIRTLDYLFQFLDAYDFGAETNNESLTSEEKKTLINASVLGLIFEKINGYKDGSYFTPGVITQYMCHETIQRAVVEKFNSVKGWTCKTLDDLYDKIEDKSEANAIVNSIKICDPAVGSGHFLVSALNEIIAIKNHLHILLDKDGRRLKEWNITVVNDELDICDNEGEYFKYKINSPDSQRVQETLFREKRHIIEHCLFGADINPNSVNICRLRLWIELLKNAYYRADGQLETLPNIDINIKCGNSMIYRFPINSDISSILAKGNVDIKQYCALIESYQNTSSKEDKAKLSDDIKAIKNNLKEVFNITNPINLKYRKLQEEFTRLYGDSIFDEVTISSKADQHRKVKLKKQLDEAKAKRDEWLSGEKYQNALEWRIEYPEVLDENGVFIGFDVVIGNPPYISAPKQCKEDSLFKQRQAIIDSHQYNTLHQKWDLYIPFLELGIRHLCRDNGLMAMIVPYPLTNQLYGQLLREMVTRTYNLYELVDLNGTMIFENAKVSNCIPFVKKCAPEGETIISHIDDQSHISHTFTQPYNTLQENSKSVWNLSQEQRNSLRHSDMHVLGDYCYISKGMVLNADEASAKGAFKKENLVSFTQDEIHCRKYIEAKDMEKYRVKRVRYLEYNTDRCPSQLSRPTFPELYLRPRLIMNCLGSINTSIDEKDNYLHNHSIYCAVPWHYLADVHNKSIAANIQKLSTLKRSEMEELSKQVDIRYLLGILNCPYTNVLLTNLRSGDYHIYPDHVRKLPIPNATEEQQKPIIDLVEQILIRKKQDSNAKVSDLQSQIDEKVYVLYGLSADERPRP